MGTKFIGKVKLTKQGQATLPYEARKELGIEVDSDIYWYLVDGHLVVLKDLLSTKDVDKKLRNKKDKKG